MATVSAPSTSTSPWSRLLEGSPSNGVSDYHELATILQKGTRRTKKSVKKGPSTYTIPKSLACRSSTLSNTTLSHKSRFGIFCRSALEYAFAQSQYPSRADKELIARGCRMSLQQVTIWFQNRRDRKDLVRDTDFPVSLDSLRLYLNRLLEFGKKTPGLLETITQASPPSGSQDACYDVSSTGTETPFTSPLEIETTEIIDSPQTHSSFLPSPNEASTSSLGLETQEKSLPIFHGTAEQVVTSETMSIFNLPAPQWRRRAATQTRTRNQTPNTNIDAVSAHLSKISAESLNPPAQVSKTTSSPGFVKRIYKALPRRATKSINPTESLMISQGNATVTVNPNPLQVVAAIPQASRKVIPLPRRRPHQQQANSWLVPRNSSSISTSSFSSSGSSSPDDSSTLFSRSSSLEPLLVSPQLPKPGGFESLGFESHVFSWERPVF